ncbi:hypothetical protein Anas_10721, partial [Armadillidium nasatum]
VEEESYGVILDIPVLSLNTNYTYVNYYCAICNNDSSSILQLDFEIGCEDHYLSETDENMTINEFLLEAKYIPRKRMYERALPVDNNSNNEFVDGRFKVPASNTGFGSSQTVTSSSPSITPTSPLTQTCHVQVKSW